MSGAGISAQAGFAVESTAGTFATPTKFLELVSEDVRAPTNVITRTGIRAGRRTMHGSVVVGHNVNGPLTVPLTANTLPTLFRAALGGVSTSGSGPYTHVITPGTLTDDTLTLQVGRPRGSSTTVDVANNLGCSVDGFNFTASVGDTNQQNITFDITGMQRETSSALASASYASGSGGFYWTQASVSVGGSARDVTSFGITYANNLRKDYKTISATAAGRSRLARENGKRTITGTLSCDYDATTLRDAVAAGTNLAFSATFSDGTHSIVFAGNIFPTEGEATVGGPEILEQPFSFSFEHATSDASAFTITVVSADATI
jgi:hypothetical protein